MKQIALFAFAALALLQAVSAQKLIVGERAPELRIGEWLSKVPAEGDMPRLVEFFHSASKPSTDRIPSLNALAKKYDGKLHVIVVTRESRDKVAPALADRSNLFYAGLDDAGKTFSAYGVRYLPFSVLIDAKGRTRWFGNSAHLTEEIINQNL